MKLNTKRAILSAAGLMLSAGNALAEATNTSSSDIVGNLGFFSTVAGTIMMYSKYIAFFAAIISILALWVSGMFGKVHHKMSMAIDAHEGIKKWLVEAVLVVLAFIVLFQLGDTYNQWIYSERVMCQQ